MKPFFHELRRTFTSKSVLVLLIVILLFSSLSAYSSAQSQAQISSYISYTGSYGYGANDTYHIFIHLDNQYNVPVSGAQVNLTIANGTAFTEYSNTQGFANFTLSNLTPSQLASPVSKYTYVPNSTNEVYMEFSASVGAGSSASKYNSFVYVYLNQSNRYFFTTITPTKASNGTIVNKTQEIGRYEIYGNNIPGQPSRQGFNIWYEGNTGSLSPKISLYYEKINTTGPGGSFTFNTSSLTANNMTYFGSYSSFGQMNVNPSNLSSTNSTWYIFAIFTPDGQLLSFLPMQIYMPETVSQVNSQFFGTEMGIIGLFVPLMAVTSGYLTFGKDRASGALKSTLVRPVSRLSVFSSRFLANVSAVFLASVLAFIVSSMVYSVLLGAGLSMDTILYGLYAILVSIAAYTGIVYLASSLFRNQGPILAISIGSFVVLDLLWTSLFIPVIPYVIIIGVLRAVSGTVAFARGYFTLFYFSPSGYANIASYLITNQNPIYTVGTVTPAQLGVSVFRFILGGVLWIAVPVVLAVIAFLKRD